MPVPASWHPGQLVAQTVSGWADAVPPPPYIFNDSIDEHYSLFFSQLEFTPTTTLDDLNRPWVSLLSGKHGQRGFTRPVLVKSSRVPDGDPGLQMRIYTPEGTPLHPRFNPDKASSNIEVLHHPSGLPLVAAVGVMLHNRRRNKLNGFCYQTERVSDEEALMTIGVDTTCGNCPKSLTETPPSSVIASDFLLAKGKPLPQSALDVIAQADIVFLGTRHTPKGRSDPALEGHSDALLMYRSSGDDARLGCNHRGGKPGFIRSYFDEDRGRTCVVLPDYSGNRFMESVGNMVTDPVASLAIPRFSWEGESKGSDVLHITGSVETLFGEEARKEIRGVSQVTKIWVDGYSLVENALPVTLDGTRPNDSSISSATKLDPRIQWSPYNPPVKLLAAEIKAGVAIGQVAPSQERTAKLSHVHVHSPTLASFTWEVPVAPEFEQIRPGQHIIMDMSSHADSRLKSYSHMARHAGGEKDLNDDGVRSWTISAMERVASPTGSEDRIALTTTLRRANNGAVTGPLFTRARVAYETHTETHLGGHATLQDALEQGFFPPRIAFSSNVEAPVLGIGGDFTLPEVSEDSSARPLRLTYIVNGIGITPYLAHLQHLVKAAHGPADASHSSIFVTAVVSCRPGEAAIVTQLIDRSLKDATENKTNSIPLAVATIILEKGDTDSRISDDDVREGNNPAIVYKVLKGYRLDEHSLKCSPVSDVDPDRFNLVATVSAMANVDEERKVAADVLSSDAVFVCGTGPFEDVVRAAIKRREQQMDAAGRKATIVTESFNF
ncbi:hypothetical protein OC846_001124 [Tilletia horrida]|uniref:FAD-binding FR-type domain-containing protein n=1 Tax=Tilletia horrida TaxID=155126 RepID=A0AAN6JW71_9BASI|nr:hypothetical protein OC846_001124 [Tilletia horrida]KAK0569357.1 hypothetical protein OC861_000963 [Tilletia horrida]